MSRAAQFNLAVIEEPYLVVSAGKEPTLGRCAVAPPERFKCLREYKGSWGAVLPRRDSSHCLLSASKQVSLLDSITIHAKSSFKFIPAHTPKSDTKMLSHLITRACQLVFGVIVLGLSVKAIRWQKYGSAPATTSYSAFAGGFSVLVALAGIAAGFIDAIPDLLMAVVDALASFLLLAGGIAFAIALKGVDCSTHTDTSPSKDIGELIVSGCGKEYGTDICGIQLENNPYSAVTARCKTVEADAAFLFLGFLASLAAAALCYLASTRGGRGVKNSATSGV